MATSLDALEALLQFREGRPAKRPRARVHLAVPVPNPLDPTVPHLIEGDCAPARRARSVLAPLPAAGPVANPVATTVPNPLSARPATSGVAHGFGMAGEVRTNKIKDALQSKPQRGKKRDNLNDRERLELTRTRNREHARCTRMKKKARLEHLVDVEKKYARLRATEARNDLRRRNLEDLVENSAENGNSPSSTLQRLASQVISKPEFSLAGRVALSEDSGMVRVSVRGNDLDSGEVQTLSGVVSAEFSPGAADVSTASVYWSSPGSNAQNASRAGIAPSVSVLSFSS
ncbi:hypothetical protein ACHAWF_018312 [Thalassiosira exigua]